LRMLSNILVSSGTQYSAEISLRTIIKEALRTNAVSVVICHNHPHCDETASAEDREATKQISQALRMINVELIDHIIITEERTYSLRQYGYLTLF
ncbi:MAG: JAB domain-containing protein, partial [Oscillospiraceae bacterium]|nr:JAB domain-containing protein [Oscillospiraceae bacterium]